MSYLYDIIKLGENMKINRLFQIVYILLERKTITAKELADKFEVSTRTIYRDIEVLSSSKIPIYANKGKGGGINLLDDFVLDKSILSEEEQNQILFSLQSLQKLNINNEKKLLEKMSMLFNKSSKNWIEVDFSNWGIDNCQNNKFNSIKDAILNKKIIEFKYYNSRGEESVRQVEPLQVWFKDKSWYIKAYCRIKQDYRIFKIARIKDIKILEENFERELPKETSTNYQVKIIPLELEIKKEMSYRVYDEFEKENISKKENGDFIIKVEYPENDWVYGYILSFGEHIKVISPEYAKNIIREKLKKAINNYL